MSLEEEYKNEMTTANTLGNNIFDLYTIKPSSLREVWVGRLLLNCLSYSTIIIPCLLLVTFAKKKKILENKNASFWVRYLRMFVEGTSGLSFEDMKSHKTSTHSAPPIPSFLRQSMVLGIYATGLLLSYLTWGVLQERIMTYEYKEKGAEKGEKFDSSQFIVLVNRILAFLVAMVVTMVMKQPTHKAPTYKYMFSSFSNIMSSWCQYEALKYVSFPVQVLAKTSKVIPVMFMGKLVSRRSYSLFEYVTAGLISIGVFVFLISSKESSSKTTTTTISGLVILAGYLIFDSFTTNWQDKLFQQYHMRPIQMMAGVNFFSILLTFVSLLEQGNLFDSLAFTWRHPTFFLHICILSLTSAVGQVFIFATISTFGPATFAIVMTVRQGLAILLSCIIYGHQVSTLAGMGVCMIFFSLFIRIYHKQTKTKAKKKVVVENKPEEASGEFQVTISK